MDGHDGIYIYKLYIIVYKLGVGTMAHSRVLGGRGRGYGGRILHGMGLRGANAETPILNW